MRGFEAPWALKALRRAAQQLRRVEVPSPTRGMSFMRDPEHFPDAASQTRYLRQLNSSGQHDAVVQLFEARRLPFPEAALADYVTALARTQRLDNSALLDTLRRGYLASAAQASATGFPAAGLGAGGFSTAGSQALPGYASTASRSFAGSPAAFAMPPGGAHGASAAGAAAAAAALGSAKNPVFTAHAEPGFLTQAWRSVRLLGLAFVALAGVGAALDERGLGRGGPGGGGEVRAATETGTRLDDVKGVDEAKAELEEVVAFLKDPSRFTSLGGKLPRGVLLVGPPGTGKTMLARAVAGEAGVPFFYASGSEFEEMFVGVGARRVRDLFAAAKKASPAIVFIDEIDAVGGKRSPRDQHYMKMTLNQLLVEMDGFSPSDGVVVIAATNLPESLDPALVRPGRFDRHVAVPNPDVEGRLAILKAATSKIPLSSDVDLVALAKGTPGCSGADLVNVVNVASVAAARDGLDEVTNLALDHARDRVLMGAERRSAAISPAARALTAFHEGGHALVALLTPGAMPVHKATVVPRGQALGMVTQLPDDEHMQTRRQLLASMDVAMGGRAAEELVFGDPGVTTGASSDLEQATRLAEAMVGRYGMSDAIGSVALTDRQLSAQTKAAFETEVRRLVDGAHARAKALLLENRHVLDALARELLDRETLTAAQMTELIDRVRATAAAGQGPGDGALRTEEESRGAVEAEISRAPKDKEAAAIASASALGAGTGSGGPTTPTARDGGRKQPPVEDLAGVAAGVAAAAGAAAAAAASHGVPKRLHARQHE